MGVTTLSTKSVRECHPRAGAGCVLAAFSRKSPREWVDRGDAYMITPLGAVPRPAALYLPRRSAAGLGISSHWKAIALIAARHRYCAFPFTLAASALAGALATSAILDRGNSRPEATARDNSIRNETIVYRRARPPESNVEEHYSEHPHTEQVEASDELENDEVPSNFPRAVQTLQFINPDAHVSVAEEARPSIRQALINVGGFVAFSAKDGTTVDDNRERIPPRNRTGSMMDPVDDYLWDVYQRVPIKKDGSGDFTWKDPAAAKKVGLALRDYVICGMDPEFREQLYHAGRAMDAAGLQWSMLSAFRDDYRQSLASGYKAGVSNSLHGGSRRTGGYGHGRAIDITGPEGMESDVWRWIDAHGAKYGLHRPLPGRDPAHVQQRGDWHKIALALRESRIRVATSDKPKVTKSVAAAVR